MAGLPPHTNSCALHIEGIRFRVQVMPPLTMSLQKFYEVGACVEVGQTAGSIEPTPRFACRFRVSIISSRRQ
jgi:hypothetical protein